MAAATGFAPGVSGMAPAGLYRRPPRHNTEAYDRIDESGYRRVADHPLSTFSIDVDTASYSNVRRFLKNGGMPPADAVRIEELINYFRFDYAAPKTADPFAVTTEVAACPWNPAHRIALVGLKARPIAADRTPARNLVFLLDVSGSMDEPDKLPLVQTAMRMLADTLTASDRVAIVVYAGASGLVLPSTTGDRKTEIQRAIAELTPGGSTNGAAGIRLAYDTAAAHFIKGGINRVILATDGDFNVGVTSEGELTRLIETRRETRRVPLRARRRHRQPQGLDHGEAGGPGKRQLCLPRQPARGAACADRGGRLHARDRREGCQDSGRIQPAQGRRVSVDWLREPPDGQ